MSSFRLSISVDLAQLLLLFEHQFAQSGQVHLVEGFRSLSFRNHYLDYEAIRYDTQSQNDLLTSDFLI